MPKADAPGTVSSIFVAFDTKHHFEQIRGPIMEHVITLLTGRSSDDLNQVGGLRLLTLLPMKRYTIRSRNMSKLKISGSIQIYMYKITGKTYIS